jgi:FKBP-type peptidyl-prolyl cis-trans isomerase FkpA
VKILLLAAILSGCAAIDGPLAPSEPPEFAFKPQNSFQEEAAKQPGVRPIRWGGWIQTLSDGAGPQPTPDSRVTVHYRGMLTDGTEFDSSYKRGQPATFSLRGVVPCWTNGVPMMKTGEKAKLVCPPSAAYGDAGSPPTIPGRATLVFEIELLAIVQR